MEKTGSLIRAVVSFRLAIRSFTVLLNKVTLPLYIGVICLYLGSLINNRFQFGKNG